MSILEINSLKKVYTTRFGANEVTALKNVSFTVEKGEYVAVMGESGSGKTTLLNIVAALDKPTSGSVVLNGNNITKLHDKQLAAFRRDHLGFVFQDFNLLDTFTLEDNIFLPLVLAGLHLAFAMPIVSKVLVLFGMANTKIFIITAAASFCAFALFYGVVYKITSNAYYKIVSGM